MCACVCACVHIRTYVHACMHECLCAHTYIRTYIMCMCIAPHAVYVVSSREYAYTIHLFIRRHTYSTMVHCISVLPGYLKASRSNVPSFLKSSLLVGKTCMHS